MSYLDSINTTLVALINRLSKAENGAINDLIEEGKKKSTSAKVALAALNVISLLCSIPPCVAALGGRLAYVCGRDTLSFASSTINSLRNGSLFKRA